MKTTYWAEAARACPQDAAVKTARMATVNKGRRIFMSVNSKKTRRLGGTGVSPVFRGALARRQCHPARRKRRVSTTLHVRADLPPRQVSATAGLLLFSRFTVLPPSRDENRTKWLAEARFPRFLWKPIELPLTAAHRPGK